VREIEARVPSGHHGGVAVGPFPNDQVVEAFGSLHTDAKRRRSQSWKFVCEEVWRGLLVRVV
jgi:hypothetical protein